MNPSPDPNYIVDIISCSRLSAYNNSVLATVWRGFFGAKFNDPIFVGSGPVSRTAGGRFYGRKAGVLEGHQPLACGGLNRGGSSGYCLAGCAESTEREAFDYVIIRTQV